MKKIILAIFIELLLLYNLIFSLYGSAKYIQTIILLSDYPAELNDYLMHYISWIVLYFVSTITSLTVMVLVAIKDFPVFKPLIEKFNNWNFRRKQTKAAQKQKNKEKRIAKLEKELTELKKD